MLVVFCLLCVSCGQREERAVKTIGVSQSSLDDAWRLAMVRDMETECSNYDDLKIVVLDADNDSRLQRRQVRELIDRRVDVLVLSPVESQPLTRVAEEAFRAGIPLVVTDRKVNTDSYTVFVGADNWRIGYQAGEFAADRLADLRRRPHIAEVWGLESSSPAQERHNGFAAALADRGIDAVTTAVHGDWSYDRAAERLTDLGAPGQYDLVYSHNDVMAIAAREYFDRLDTLRDGRICIIGVDAVAGAGLEAVADGRIDVSFLYPTAGAEVVRIARRILDGDPVAKNIELASATVDRSGAETMLLQTQRLEDYRQSIAAKKERIDDLSSRFGSLRSLLITIAVLCVLLVVMLFFIFRVNRKIRIRNEQLGEKNRHEEEQNRKLIALNREIEAATEQKLRFFTNVSHEVRTPLTLILGPLDKLSAALSGSVYAPDLRIMRRNGERLLREINRMLDFRRLENGREELRREPVQLVPFVGEIKCYFDSVARERRIDYRFEAHCDETLRVALDRTLIEKVLVNLLSNAFKFVADGGRVAISVGVEEASVRLEVSDNGRGISPERMEHLFERFYTEREAGGTGIGLHLVREYVMLHGGTIRAESVPGRDTRFLIELPRGPVAASAPQAADEGLLEEESESVTRELLAKSYDCDLLVVDDDDDMRTYITESLSANFRVHGVADGARALEWIAAHEVSLVVSDVMMPEINGFELCKRIKGDIRYCHIPVLLLTALSSERHAHYGVATGADGYLAKPFRTEYLAVRIIRLLENRQRMLRRLLEKVERGSDAPEGAGEPAESLDDLFLRRFVGLIGEVYADSEYNVERLSGELGMSRGHLYRKVREVTGMSPVNYLVDYRLRRARELLTQGRLSVSEVAYATGFSSPSYFSKMFRSRFGMTPSEVKKS